jgi:hypothetical protein
VALVGQNVTVQVRDQQVVIRQAGRIVARHTRQEANQRSRQVIAGHWAGLVPQRVIEAAHADGLAEVVNVQQVLLASAAQVVAVMAPRMLMALRVQLTQVAAAAAQGPVGIHSAQAAQAVPV